MAYVRLQGLEWHVRKHKLKILEIIRTDKNNVRLNCFDPSTRQYYSHYLSDTELEVFNQLLNYMENILFEKEQMAFSEGE